MYADNKEKDEVTALLEGSQDDQKGIKRLFVMYQDQLPAMEGVTLRFISRPGVSYSFRAGMAAGKDKGRVFFWHGGCD